MMIPYFEETGFATMPGAAFFELEVVFLAALELAVEVAETEEAATTLLETKALLVLMEEEAEAGSGSTAWPFFIQVICD